MNETWKFIAGYEGQYEISNLGRVRSWISKHPPTIKALRKRRDGYLDVCLKVNQKVRCFLVHVLVANAFLDEKREHENVNHKDGIKSHNNISNLEWATQSENVRHAFDTGLKHPPSAIGHRFSKLTQEAVRDLRRGLLANYNGTRFKRGMLKEAGDRHGVTAQAIKHAVLGISWGEVA